MTTRELINHDIRMTWIGTSRYRISCTYRNEDIHCETNDSMMYDAFTSCEPYTKEMCCGMTWRQAAEKAYHRCVGINTRWK